MRAMYGSDEAVVVTAPTGVAAINVGGQTLHSFAGCGVPKSVDEFNRARSQAGSLIPSLSLSLSLSLCVSCVCTVCVRASYVGAIYLRQACLLISSPGMAAALSLSNTRNHLLSEQALAEDCRDACTRPLA